MLDVLCSTDWEVISLGWDRPVAVALLEAGVLAPPSDALTEKSWASSGGDVQAVGLLPSGSMSEFLAHAHSCSTELHEDRSTTASMVARYLTNKHGCAKPSRLPACAYWLVGMSMCNTMSPTSASMAMAAKVTPDLLDAIPLDGAVNCLGDGLADSVAGVVQSIAGQSSMIAIPSVLVTLAMRVYHAVESSQLPADLSSKARNAMEASLGTFMATVSKPLCDAVVSADPESLVFTSEALADLMYWVSGATGHATECFPSAEWVATAAESMLSLYASTAGIQVEEEGETTLTTEQVLDVMTDTTLNPKQRIAAAAHAAFVTTHLTGGLLQQLLTSDAVKGTDARPLMGNCALDAIYQHLVLFKGGIEEVDELLRSLSNFLTKAPAALLQNTMRAVAALCEHAASKAEAAPNGLVDDVCGALEKTCKKLGAKFSAGQLVVVVTACAALAPLSTPYTVVD
eukprot:3169961-Amphidinium_carterae.1